MSFRFFSKCWNGQYIIRCLISSQVNTKFTCNQSAFQKLSSTVTSLISSTDDNMDSRKKIDYIFGPQESLRYSSGADSGGTRAASVEVKLGLK